MPNGKNTLSYKRKVVKESNDLVVGSKSVAFAHQASAGETFIPFNALVQPTRWVESGFNNPNGSTLLSLQLQVFADNIEVSSSAKGYIQKEEYVVKNNGIYFKDFVAEENEVFEVVVGDLLVTGNRLVDMRLIRVEGELADTETDFVIGNQVDVNKEEIIVFRDGIQMFRSDNNDDSGATGNYYYLDNDGDGKASSIRFFEAAVGTEAILVASTGGRVDSPNVSTFQEIEKLAGQIDAVIPTVAALAGVPESNFRAGPNYVDLKNFGDKVIENESTILSLKNLEVINNEIIQETNYSPPNSNNGSMSVQDLGTENEIEGGLALFQKVSNTEIEVLQDCIIHINYRWNNGGVSNTATDANIGGTLRGAIVVPALTIVAAYNVSARVRQGDIIFFRTYLTHQGQGISITAEKRISNVVSDLL